MPYRILWIFVTLSLFMSPIAAQSGVRLAVTWVEMGNLWIWQEGDSSPTRLVQDGVIQPYLSPDGQHIAFTRGDVAARSLWVVKRNTGELANLYSASADEPSVALDQLQWLNNDTIYFNTNKFVGPFGQRQDDLWRAAISTGIVELQLAAGQGGFFSFSPDRRYIALVRAGVYGEKLGNISVMNLDDNSRRSLLEFPAISTGSEYALYPPVQWNSDSNGLTVAIPPENAIYDDGTSLPTAIWYLAIDGKSTQLTSVLSSFFGVPSISPNRMFLTYVRRKGAVTNNQVELVVAASDNSQQTVYAAGNIGTLSTPTWLPEGNQFFFINGDIGNYWVGTPNQMPERLAEPMYYPHFVDNHTYIYATYPGSPYELRYAHLGDQDSYLIATFNNPTPVIDALLIP
ncbi:MAG: hypothetical protein R3E39_14475 [Anaerolineae bacterium]